MLHLNHYYTHAVSCTLALILWKASSIAKERPQHSTSIIIPESNICSSYSQDKNYSNTGAVKREKNEVFFNLHLVHLHHS